MAKKESKDWVAESIRAIELRSALQDRYLAYALSTIMHRALPDVRDGLKPVHRRIIYAMHLLKLYPEHGYAKCARIVGDVMGKFHPHGDASIYDALVRMAQDFAVRYPLIDGQGNFGNIDGDNAAAMRYTEARMLPVAPFLLEGINENAIDYRPTYNEEDEEPVVLPGAFPNLLANGASGIAVGMATSIPPHNVAELCEAALYLIKNPQATTKDLLAFIKGPDFPTGGVVLTTPEEMANIYESGRGAFRLRASWHKEETGRGGYRIVVTQIPYQVQKSRLIEKIAELLVGKKLPLLDNIYDESAEDIRIVLEPKARTVDSALLMESLFRLTELEIRFSLNMNVLSGGKVPNVLSLKEVLAQWLAHRRDVLLRRSQFRLDGITRRMEVVQGYLIAYLNLDKVIAIIRDSDHPKPELMAAFDLTDMQAESILNMRLRSLRRLEELELRKEFSSLENEKNSLHNLLGSERIQWKFIASEVQKVRDFYAPSTAIGRRRTLFGEVPQHDLEQIEQAMIDKEPLTIILSEKGWLRAVKGHLTDLTQLNFKEGDGLHLAIHASTVDKLILATNGGKFFTLNASALPRGRGPGEPIRLLLDIDQEQDIRDIFVYQPEQKLLLLSYQGYGFRVKGEQLLANTRKGKQVMNVKYPDRLSFCKEITGDSVAVVGENRKLSIFSLDDVPELTKGRGVRLQRYKDGGVRDVCTFLLEKGFSWKDSAGRVFTKPDCDLLPWKTGRGSAGRLVPSGFPRSGLFSG